MEKRKRKEFSKRKTIGIFDESTQENDFSGFWWDKDEVMIGKTYTMCKFPLDDRVEERDSVLARLKEFKDNLDNSNVSAHELEKFCEELENIVTGLREVSMNVRSREIEKDLDDLSNMLTEVETGTKLVYMGDDSKDKEQDMSQNNEIIGPYTRSKGKVKDYEWVMEKGL